MTSRAWNAQRSKLLAGVVGGLMVMAAVQAGAAERVVLGEYFTSVY